MPQTTPEDGPGEFGRFLRQLRNARGVSQNQLSARTGVDPARISKFERQNRPLRSDSYNTVERLDVALEAGGRLLELAGLAPRSDVKTVRTRPPMRELILSEETLTMDQRRVLLGVYETLLATQRRSETSRERP